MAEEASADDGDDEGIIAKLKKVLGRKTES